MPEVPKSGGLIGAELRGLDLTRQYPDETYQAILRAWAEHGVIFLRDQQLDAEQRDAFVILFCQEVPPWGGDTQWAAMGPTFEGLSAGLQATLLGLRAVHANVRKLGYSYAQTDPPEPSVDEYDKAEGPVHPVVRLIPETERRVLYVNPEFTTRFRWAPGSIAMWDNRQTWHFAVNDYQGQRRVMHRILLSGSKPVPAA